MILKDPNLLLNAIFGDGHVSLNKVTSRGTVHLYFSSSNRSIIEYKAKLLGGKVGDNTQNKNSFSPGKKVYTTSKAVPLSFTSLTKIDLISQIEYEDLLLWILDDGSYHKKKGFLNLCTHALSRAENIELSFHLWHYLGIESRLLFERKKDGRIFSYLYIPGAQYDSIKQDLLTFTLVNSIKGFEYKAGGIDCA